ncbi:MAG TPA: CoA-binding protein [Vicinamibacterales bacterium]
MKTDQATIDTFIAAPALALLGASRSGTKFGNIALRELRANGYRVYPVHPIAAAIDGVRCFRSLADLPEPVGGVVISLPPDQAVSAVRSAAAAGIHRVWLQRGAASPYVVTVCRELGIEPVVDECILMFASPHGIHRAHRWVHDVLHFAA